MTLKTVPNGEAQKDLEKGFQLDVILHAEFDPLIKQVRPNQ